MNRRGLVNVLVSIRVIRVSICTCCGMYFGSEFACIFIWYVLYIPNMNTIHIPYRYPKILCFIYQIHTRTCIMYIHYTPVCIFNTYWSVWGLSIGDVSYKAPTTTIITASSQASTCGWVQAPGPIPSAAKQWKLVVDVKSWKHVSAEIN